MSKRTERHRITKNKRQKPQSLVGQDIIAALQDFVVTGFLRKSRQARRKGGAK